MDAVPMSYGIATSVKKTPPHETVSPARSTLQPISEPTPLAAFLWVDGIRLWLFLCGESGHKTEVGSLRVERSRGRLLASCMCKHLYWGWGPAA